MTNIFAWSKTALSNQNSDSGINWFEGQDASSVNNSARAMMQRIAELLEDLSAANSTGGTADAQTVTLDSAFTALGTFKVCVITATLAVTGTATLDVNSIGAKPWRKITAAGEVELEAGDVNVNSRCANIYSSAAGGGSGAWILLNPGTVAINGAAITALLASAAFIEAAQDATGAMVDASLTYVDATPLLQRAALTGDVTAAVGSNATTLATVNANVGSFGLAASVTQFTVNAKGLITAAANVAIAIAAAAITDATAAGRSMLTAATVAAQTALLDVATAALKGLMSAADKTKLDAISGTNTGDQTITLTGDVTGSGTGSFAASLAVPTASGVYTPTLFNVTNLDGSAEFECQYMRVGNTVTVSGQVNINPTGAGPIELGISLPIASNFGTTRDCAGTSACLAFLEAMVIHGDITDNRAVLAGIAQDISNHGQIFIFTYRVI